MSAIKHFTGMRSLTCISRAQEVDHVIQIWFPRATGVGTGRGGVVGGGGMVVRGVCGERERETHTHS